MTEVFDELFIEKEELNETFLKDMLSGRIRMTSDGEVIFSKDFDPKVKILLFLLSNKVFVIKKIKADESESSKNIELKTGMPGGTVRRTLRELRKVSLLMQKGKNYYVPNHSLIKIKNMVETNDKRN